MQPTDLQQQCLQCNFNFLEICAREEQVAYLSQPIRSEGKEWTRTAVCLARMFACILRRECDESTNEKDTGVLRRNWCVPFGFSTAALDTRHAPTTKNQEPRTKKLQENAGPEQKTNLIVCVLDELSWHISRGVAR